MTEGDHSAAPSVAQEDEASAPDAPPSGTIIDGAYRVVSELGQGGTGRVMLAMDQFLDREVALKLFRTPLLLTEASRERFMAEAQTMAKVRHRNVVSIHAYGDSDYGPYFAMEYVPGPSLNQWLDERAPLAVDEALSVLTQLCQGVEAIHTAGAVHRDLKPANVLIGAGHRVAVADLGLSRLVGRRAPTDRLTVETVGTPWYMAPELVLEGRIAVAMAPRIDIYALGVIAFELFTGRRPFNATSVIALLRQHVSKEAPRPSDLRPELPERFDAPILKALSKSPADRHATASELLADLLESRKTPGPIDRSHLRILVADDDQVFLDLAASVLEQSFPEVEILRAADGAEALAAIEHSPPTVAVLDLDMPKYNAIEIVAALNAVATKRPRLVVVTSAGGAAEWRILSQMATDAFLLKPIRPAQLVETITGLLTDD